MFFALDAVWRGDQLRDGKLIRTEKRSSSMKRYAIVIEKAPSNYSAYVPDLPGCVATGATVEETESLLREAIDLHLEGMREDGLPIPEPVSVVEYLEVPV
jgi:predicted RNase H-like HicB family nuclease